MAHDTKIRFLQGKILIRLSLMTLYLLNTFAQLNFNFFIALLRQGFILPGFGWYTLVFSILISSVLGPIVGLMEIAVYPTLLHKLSFPVVLFFKTLVNLLIVLLTLLSMTYFTSP